MKNSPTPMISVITICYNAESTLPATMRSVAAQSYGDFEHLIIDGASRDSTVDLARRESIGATRIFSEPDKGIYDAMNKGLAKAQGRYVIFLNAGDAFHDSATLAEYGKAALSDPDIVYGDTVIVDDYRRILGQRHLSAPESLTFESFSKGMLVCHQAFMAKRSLAGPYDLRYRFSADFDWTVRILRKTTPEKCVNLHRVTIDYLTAGTTDKNRWKSLRERFRIMCRHYGTAGTVLRHISFVGRAVSRKLRPMRK